MRDQTESDANQGFFSDKLARCEAWCDRHRPALILVVGLWALLGCMAVGAAVGRRPPTVHDEWSYLLAADTFAHGRLTNPPHPMWKHFETFHVLHQPTYMSKYPPLQGAMLALGDIVAGHPMFGVWLSVALMGMALCWMLMAWAPSHWATAGAILGVTFFGIVGSWGNSYWGGAAAATGGALLYGAVRRLSGQPRLRDGAWLGVGLVVLALSRPFEGVMVAVPAGLIVFVALMRSPTGARRTRIAALGCTTLVVLGGAAFQLYYNYRGTGRVLEMPYMVYARQYESAPVFVAQALPPLKQDCHEEIQRHMNAYRDKAVAMKAAGIPHHAAVIARSFLLSFGKEIHLTTLLALAGLCLGWRDKWVWIALGVIVWMFFVHSFVVYYFLHYSAPVFGVLMAVCTIGLWKTAALLALTADRCAGAWFKAHPVRAGLVAAGAIIALAVPAALAARPVIARRFALTYTAPPVGSVARRDEMKQRVVEASSGPALVVVRYLPGHPFDSEEWVNNAADIDGSEVVWARDLGPEQNQSLTNYYQSLGRPRTVWLLEVADRETAPKLTRYAPDGR